MKKGSLSKIFFVRPSLTPLNYRRPLFFLIESRDRSSSRSRSTTLIQRKKGCTKDKLNSSIDDEFGTQPSLGVHRHYLSIVVSSPFSSRNRESKWTVARGVHPPSKYTDEAKEENWTRETETTSFEPSPRRPGKRDRFSRFLSSDP